jgi:hypothetical protein
MAIDTTRCATPVGADCALGRSSFKALIIKGVVMIKITSKTIITSTKGVTLISLIGF